MSDVYSKTHRPVIKVLGKSVSGEKEVWQISIDGDLKTLVTSPKSVSIMDGAVVRFGPALRRLADR